METIELSDRKIPMQINFDEGDEEVKNDHGRRSSIHHSVVSSQLGDTEES